MGAISGSGLSLGTLWVAIAAEVDEALKEFQKFSDDVGKLIDQQKDKWAGLAAVGENFSQVGKALTVGLTAPLVGLGVASAKAAGDFEESMNKIQAVSDATGVEMDAMRQQAIKLGADTKFSAQEAAEGMGNLAAAGLTTAQTMAAMPGVLDLAAAGTLEVNRAAEVTTDTLGQFGLAADQAGHVADVMAKAAGASSVNVEQLSQSMKLVGAVANQAGMDLEDTSTALALLAQGGLKATEAGTGLRGVIASLESPSKKAKAVLDALGVSANDSSGQMRPLDQIMKDLAQSGASTSDMFKIFGRESAAAAAVLKQQAGPAWAAMAKQISDSDGAAKKMADTMQKGLKGSLEQLKGSLDTVLIALGTGLNPVIEVLTKMVTNFVNQALLPMAQRFADLPTPIKAGILVLLGMAAAVGPLLFLMGQLATSIIAIGPAVAVMAKAVGMSSLQFTGWIGLIGLAIGALTTLVVWMRTSEEGMAKGAEANAAAARALAFKNEAIGASLAQYPKLAQAYFDAAAAQRKEADAQDKAAAAHRQAAVDAAKRAEEEKKQAEQRKKDADELQKQIKDQMEALKKLGTGHVELGKTLDGTGKKTKEAADGIKGLTARGEILRAMWQILEGEHQKIIRSLAQAYIAFDRNADPMKELGDMTKTLGQVTVNTDANLRKMADGLATKMPPAMAAILALNNPTGAAEEALKKLGITSAEVAKSMADHLTTLANLVKSNPNAKEWEKEAAELKALEAQLQVLIATDKAFSDDAIVMRARIKELKDALHDAAEGVDDLTKAFHELGLKSPKELNDAAKAAEAAYAKIAGSAGANSKVALEAQIAAVKKRIEAEEAASDTIDTADRELLRKLEDRLAKYTQKTKTIWQEWAQAISSTIKSFIGDVVERLFKGSDVNKQLDQQAAELQKSLAERAQEYQKSVDDIKAAQTKADQDYRDSLDKEDQAFADSIAEKKKEYEDYAASVPDLIGKAEAEAAAKLADTTDKLKRDLADRTIEYKRYAEDVGKNIAEIRDKHAEELANELEDLQKNLDERRQEYADYVADAQTKLSRLRGDTANDIADETQDVQDGIRDRTTDYNRFAEDTQKKIADVRKKNGGVYSDEEGDLQTSLQRRKQDLDQYVSDQLRDLDTFTRRAQEKQAQEEQDLQTALDRKKRDQEEYEQGVQDQRDETVAKHAEQQQKEIDDQQTALARRTEDYDAYLVDNKAQMEQARTDYQTQVDTDRANLLQSLADRQTDLDQFMVDALGKHTQNREDIRKTYEDSTGDLAKELGDRQTDYQKFVDDTNAKLAQLKEDHRSIWQDIGDMAVGALEKMGAKMLEIAGEKYLGVLLSKLGDLIGSSSTLGGILNNIGGALGGGGGAAGSAAGGAASAAGGAASNAGKIAGQVIGSTVTGVLTSVFTGISAVADVLSLFGVGRAGEKDRLNLIANATTALAQMFGNPVMGIISIINTSNQLDNLNAAMAGWVHDAWVELLDDLTAIKNHTGDGFDALERIDSDLLATNQLLGQLINVEAAAADRVTGLLGAFGGKLDHLLVSTEKALTMNLYGTDPSLVGGQIATQLRMQGGTA